MGQSSVCSSIVDVSQADGGYPPDSPAVCLPLVVPPMQPLQRALPLGAALTRSVRRARFGPDRGPWSGRGDGSCPSSGRVPATLRSRHRRHASTTTRDATASVTSHTHVTLSSPRLRSLAQEADRLTQMASSAHHRWEAADTASHWTPTTAAETTTTTTSTSDYSAALQAANELLRISYDYASSYQTQVAASPTTRRATTEDDLASATAGFTASLHRSLLTVIAWCTRIILQPQDPDPPTQTLHEPTVPVDHSLLLGTALHLARRANDLQLPLHLPLYERLLQATALVSRPHELVESTLEVSSWVVTSLHGSTVPAHWFLPALRALLSQHAFAHASDLLVGLRYLHGIRYLPVPVTSELLRLLRDLVPRDNDESQALEPQVAHIVALLEPSVHYALQQTSEILQETVRSDLRDLLQDMEPTQVEDTIASLESSMQRDMEEMDLAEGVPADGDAPTLERSHGGTPIAGMEAGSRRKLTELLQTKLFDSDDGFDLDSDGSVGETRDFLYVREMNDANHDYPDVTTQFVTLNRNRPIWFSPLYEQILVQSEFDGLDEDLLSSFMSGDSDSDLDDDDDSGDDAY